MADRRYQIFISSTFRDLTTERQSVLDAILELNQFPAGMEIFPAATDTPWELISKVIAESDYYLLVVGGKYGSMDEAGISYTEREYDLAVDLGKPILAFLHGDPDSIPAGRTEASAAARKRLSLFRKKIEHRHCKYWLDAGDLKSKVIVGLTFAFRLNPQVGWVQGGGPDVVELLTRLATLQKRYDELESENARLRARLGGTAVADNLASGDDLLRLDVPIRGRAATSLEVTWDSILDALGPLLLSPTLESELKEAVQALLATTFALVEPTLYELLAGDKIDKTPAANYREFELGDEPFQMIIHQLAALGLIEASTLTRTDNNRGDMSTSIKRTWALTSEGRRVYLARRALTH